ncbi:hypothetical protein [Uliginosibacterium sp. 31-12]|uniref:hypothetical protein n=1 Tax=Uliginosibacterium sp. 31-12 TaxID=3062781 RepID=UPI0026E3BEC6|nr:hypothetical protein [Uliginosibacterium sp. 31-12]MDO6385605.1 hypothetical protein [Uliginosibacterium sp. 31-12]
MLNLLVIWSGWLVAIVMLCLFAWQMARRIDAESATNYAYQRLNAELSRRPICDGLRDQFDREAA